ncbi:MAG: type 1 glutamine amidotransferase domain-containing protein [Planctomycetota bacterium]
MLQTSFRCFVASAILAPFLLALLWTPPLFAEDPDASDAPQRVAIVLTNHDRLGETDRPTGFYLSEAAHPWEVFTEAGFDVVLVSPDGGTAPIDPKSLDLGEPANAAFLGAFPPHEGAVSTEKIADAKPADFDAVFVAGGHGTMWDLPDHEPLQRLLASVYEQGGVVAAVCHGPAALVNVRLADGSFLVADKHVAGFTNAEEDAVQLIDAMPFLLQTKLEERGAKFMPAGNFEPNVVTDRRLVTGQNPASARGTAYAVAQLLREKVAALD